MSLELPTNFDAPLHNMAQAIATLLAVINPVVCGSAQRGVRRLDRRPADAGVDQRGRRRAAENAGAARRRRARIRLQPRRAGLPDSKIGTFTPALHDEAKKNGWTVISMKNDWKRIFAFE
jgi:hypothetical protein